MQNTMILKALYYPFARCANPNTLKKAMLLFDEIWFVDPTSQRMKDGLTNDESDIQSIIEERKYIHDLSGPLLDQKIGLLYDAEQLILDNDHLLSNAFKADLKDNEVWRLCTTPGTPNTWDVLRRKVPPSAFELLNPQPYGRINYGTASAKAVFHKEFMECPDLRDYIAEDATEPFPLAVEDNDPDNKWYRYLFHDGKEARERNSWYYKEEKDRKKYLDVEFSCVFPFTHASSLAVNQVLLISHKFGLVPFTDSMIHHQLLHVKYQRALRNMSLFEESATSGAIQPNSAKLQMLIFNLLSNIIPDELLDQISVVEAVRFRDSSKQAFERLRQQMGEMITQIKGRVWDENLETEIQRTISEKILSESLTARKSAIAVYEKLFGKTIPQQEASIISTMKKSAIAVYEKLFGKTIPQQEASIISTMKVGVFPGLDFLAMLAIGSANKPNTLPSDFIKTFCDITKPPIETSGKLHNSLTYLF